MRTLRHGRPLWLDQRAPARRYPKQRGTLDVDVVIVGGGITGAICAYLFAGAGVRVALLESARVGRGSTLASTALLMQEPDRDFSDLAHRFGRAATREIWMSLARATRDLTRTIQSLNMNVGLCTCESVFFTLDPEKVRGLHKEFMTRKRAGLPGRWLSPQALHRKTGIRAQGAILTPGNAQVNPIRTCHGFLAAAAQRGARIFERTHARRVDVSKTGVVVRTANGTIAASHIVVATGYATGEFRGLVGRFRMKDTYVLATRRLRSALKHRVMAWDTDRPYHYLRWTDDGRLLFGGEDTIHRNSKNPRSRIMHARARLMTYLAQVYPDLADEKPEYAWEGLFAETADGLPYVGEHARYPRHLFALGYGGNGMTASFIAAKTLVGMYQGRDTGNLFAFDRARR
ncbi:MAG TPA: FAD-binding oxidoreductase [Vicinamibacterales bacterium]|nr:FAD-binding oxidoreductase [Vicinamibacterales bacterium]